MIQRCFKLAIVGSAHPCAASISKHEKWRVSERFSKYRSHRLIVEWLLGRTPMQVIKKKQRRLALALTARLADEEDRHGLDKPRQLLETRDVHASARRRMNVLQSGAIVRTDSESGETGIVANDIPSTVSSFQPLAEQRRAVDLFRREEGLRIDAYAGTGKTTTLRLLAESTSKRGLYLAFNRSIATEAGARFPKQVRCATAHSIAFRGVRRTLRYPEWKLTESLTPRLVTEAFRMPETVSFACGLVLPKHTYGGVLLKGLGCFLQSGAERPLPLHVERQDLIETLSVKAFDSFAQQVVGHIQAIWESMQYREGGLPLGHDGYLKLWALSKPEAQTDYILVDEAQDMNPVLLGVLRQIQCPLVYVGILTNRSTSGVEQ